MLESSVQAIVACYATAPRVCTLVLFIYLVSLTQASMYSKYVTVSSHRNVHHSLKLMKEQKQNSTVKMHGK